MNVTSHVPAKKKSKSEITSFCDILTEPANLTFSRGVKFGG